jgi:hypothetical protein
MRSYKIESYVPEATFLSGKDARFCRAAFEDCFVLDLHNGPAIIASCRGTEQIETSMADTAALLTLFDGKNEFLILPSSQGTLLIYPAWPHFDLALAFLLKEDVTEVEKAYQNAKRYAFSIIFDSANQSKINQRLNLEEKLCVLDFYAKRLFGDKRETNVTAQILMLANLVGCRLHTMSVSRVSANLDERETERMNAYLCCLFMTMRRCDGKVFAGEITDENTSFSTHVVQEYGIYIKQCIRERAQKFPLLNMPMSTNVAHFFTHPVFADYQMEETEAGLCLHLPLNKTTQLSSFTVHSREQEIVLTLFPI